MLPMTPHPSLQLLKMFSMPRTFLKKLKKKRKKAVITIICHLPLSTTVIKRYRKRQEMCGTTNSSFTKEAAALSCKAVGLWDGASRQLRHLWHLAAVLALSETSFSGAVWHSGTKLNGLLALICEMLLLQVPWLAQCTREAHGRELRGWINAASFGSARLELFGFNI